MTERPRGLWVRLQAAAWLDGAIQDVIPSAELLFYRSLQYASLMVSGGIIPASAIPSLGKGLSKVRVRAVNDLVRTRLWTPLDEGSGWVITNYRKYNPETQVEEQVARQARDRDRKRVQRGSKLADMSHQDSPPRARKDERDVTDGGSDRTPSGSVRSEPARSAPRSAGGAAQPADETDVVPSGSGPKLDWREELQKGRAKNPASTGRDIPIRNREWLPQQSSRHSENMQRMSELLNGAVADE